MPVIRVHKTKDYTVMSNTHLRDRNLTLKAKGLLSVMLSLPEEWDYSIAGLVAICIEKESAVVSALQELKKNRYLRVDKLMPNQTESGRIEYIYHVFENPNAEAVSKLQASYKQVIGKQELEKQGLENQGLEFQGLENQGQSITNKSITEQSITDESIKEKKESKKGTFDTLLDQYSKGDSEVRELLGEWLKVRKAKRAAMTDKAISLNLEKLDRLAAESSLSVKDYLEAVIMRGWQAFFVINDFNSNTGNAKATKSADDGSNNVFLNMIKKGQVN